jgi:acyl carrier protein
MFRKKGKASQDLVNKVLDTAARVMRGEGIHHEPDLDASLGEDGLGLDSMGRLELFHAIEAELCVRIPEEYWGTKRFKNLRHLIRVTTKG